MTDLLYQFTGEYTMARLDEVIAQFHRAIELDPNLSTAYQGLCRALTVKGDLAGAHQVFGLGLGLVHLGILSKSDASDKPGAVQSDVAKGQNRGNREPKKPKANKKPAVATTSPFIREPPQRPAPAKGKS